MITLARMIRRNVGAGAESRLGERPAVAGSLRTLAARGTLINSAFTVGLGALGLLKGFVLAGFLSRADYGIWGVLIVTLGTIVWLKQVGVGDKYVQQDEPDQELAFQKAFTLELAFTGILVLVLAAAVPVLVLIYDLPQLIAPSAVVAATLLVSAFQAPQWGLLPQDGLRASACACDDRSGRRVRHVDRPGGGGRRLLGVRRRARGGCLRRLDRRDRAVPVQAAAALERGTLRSYASFSAPLLLASAVSFVMTWSALIAAKLDLGIAAVGVIALAATTQSFTDSADQLVTGALYPAICAVRDRTALLHESFVKSNRLALMWAVPFGTALTLFASDLVHFGIGDRWRPAVIVLEVFGVAAAVNHIGFNWTAYLRARGWTRPIAIANLASMSVFLLAGIPLLLLFGLPGFAPAVALQGVGLATEQR